MLMHDEFHRSLLLCFGIGLPYKGIHVLMPWKEFSVPKKHS